MFFANSSDDDPYLLKPALITLPTSEEREEMAMNADYRLDQEPPSPAYQSAVMQQMLAEANYFADWLKLPTPHPMQTTDILFTRISAPYFNELWKTNSHWWGPMTIFSNRLFDPNLPREPRARAIQFGVGGMMATSNFLFSFGGGKLSRILRLDEHVTQNYTYNLDGLAGQPSLIDTNEAYQLAAQWLTAIGMDVPAMEKLLSNSVSQVGYWPGNATHEVKLPLYYVDFRSSDRHSLPLLNVLIRVGVLGTTKELQEIIIQGIPASAFSHRPLLLITNTIDLTRQKAANLPL